MNGDGYRDPTAETAIAMAMRDVRAHRTSASHKAKRSANAMRGGEPAPEMRRGKDPQQSANESGTKGVAKKTRKYEK